MDNTFNVDNINRLETWSKTTGRYTSCLQTKRKSGDKLTIQDASKNINGTSIKKVNLPHNKEIKFLFHFYEYLKVLFKNFKLKSYLLKKLNNSTIFNA